MGYVGVVVLFFLTTPSIQTKGNYQKFSFLLVSMKIIFVQYQSLTMSRGDPTRSSQHRHINRVDGLTVPDHLSIGISIE